MSESEGAALLEAARAAAANAYAPYSRFRVGAALLDARGAVHLGCNVENASYGLSICAERAAVFAAVAAAAPRPFAAVAVACQPESGPASGCSPCGACRQVLLEHFVPGAPVYLAGERDTTVEALLPGAFTLAPPGSAEPRV